MAKFKIEYTYEATYTAYVTVPDDKITAWLNENPEAQYRDEHFEDQLLCEDGEWFELDPTCDEEVSWGGDWDNFDVTEVEEYVRPIDSDNLPVHVMDGQEELAL